MTADRWRQIEKLFAEVVERPAAERRSFLDRVCEGDEELRRELESLLACDIPEQSLVEIPPPSAQDAPDDEPAGAMTGQRIGPYRLLRLIGHGGMGAVYLGVRDDDHYQKQVAIKLLKRGMDTDFMLGRFRQERQILANLEHPFIARMMDGGATDDGLPYFVMEYVDGVPISNYCAERNLSIPERIRIFRLVCEAVQYAHQNLVVHRDIKPSNILMTKEGIPKLLDFGIAKVVNPGLSAGVTLTQPELRMLTPDYASPEQVKGLQISTATDTYSLGAVLYELLTRQRPHRFTSNSLADMERAICEIEPEKPSLVASRNENFSPSVRKQLKRQLSGDIDTIVLAAMRKEPQRRYASAAELSEDLRRHMEGSPIVARETQWAYRAGKFMRRNRLAVGAALLIVASLVGGMIATIVQARRAERRFQLARGLAKGVVDQVKGPLERLPGSIAVRQSMIQMVIRYLDDLARDPGKDPAFELEIAGAYRDVADVEGHPLRENLGQPAAALNHYERAIAIFERHANRAETRGVALSALIGSSIQAGDIEIRAGNAAAANARLRKVAALAFEASAQDSAAVDSNAWVYLYFRLGDAETRAGAPAAALPYFQKALEVCKKVAAAGGGAHARSDLRGAYNRVADAQRDSGDIPGARATYMIVLRTAEEVMRLPDARVFDRSMLALAHQALGNLLGNPNNLNFGDRPGGISHVRAAIGIFEALADSAREDVRARDDLSGAYLSLAGILAAEQPEEALQFFEKTLAISNELSSANPSNTNYVYKLALGQIGAGETFYRLGRYRESLPRLALAMEKMQSLAGAARDNVLLTGEIGRIHRDTGDARLAIGDEEQARKNYLEGLAATEDLIRRAPSSLNFRREYADALESLGRFYGTVARRRPELKSEARQWLQKSLGVWQDWTSRKIAIPYSNVRERQVAALLAAINEKGTAPGSGAVGNP